MTATNSAEVSKKIRAAIRAKLEELGVYVDDELPDYIMVMIANKKEKGQMKEDLQLFLGQNCSRFVEWLFEIFERLQSLTSASSSQAESKSSQSKKKAPDVSHKKEKSAEDTDTKRKDRKRRSSEDKAEFVESESRRNSGSGKRSREHKDRDKQEAKVVKSKPSSRRRESPSSPVYEASKSLKKENEHSSSKSKEKTANLSSSQKESESDAVCSQRKTEVRSPRKRSKTEIDKMPEKPEKEKREERRHQSPQSAGRNDHLSTSSKSVVRSASSAKKVHDDLEKTHEKKVSSRTVAEEVIDSDEEERMAEEETAKDMRKKKVQSSAVLVNPPIEKVKTVPSQIIVKRRMPDKENDPKQRSRGVKSMFLRAIKEAEQTTRTASQIAGYGGGGELQRGVKVEHEEKKVKVDMIHRDSVDEEEGIIIDDGDALIVVAEDSNQGTETETKSDLGHRIGRRSDEEGTNLSSRKKVTAPLSSPTQQPRFHITLKGRVGRVITKDPDDSEVRFEESDEKRRRRKRRNEANPILSHLNMSHIHRSVGKKRTSDLTTSDRVCDNLIHGDENDRDVQMEAEAENEYDSGTASDAVVMTEGLSESRQTPAWNGQIELGEDDSSDDDEAQIDAVLASANSLSAKFDEVPPTPTLSRPFFRPGSGKGEIPSASVQISQIKATTQAVASIGAIGTGEKILERCKFWPNCRLDENCVYIHPTKPCMNFPNCVFGERCIYIHPACKFDQSCTNRNCPFTHSLSKGITTISSINAVVPSGENNVSSASSSAVAINSSLNSQIPCRFGNKCANAKCMFKHPKLCRFGAFCTNPTCYFWHPSTSTPTIGGIEKAKYKWKASTAV